MKFFYLAIILTKKQAMKKGIWLLFILANFYSCEREEDYSNPANLDFLLSFACESRPVSIVACPKNGDLVVLNSDPSTFDFSMKLTRYNKDGDFRDTIVDFENFDQGSYIRYIPDDIAVDEFKNLFVWARPVTDTPGGIWNSASGFCILVFNLEEGFVRELDFSAMDGGMARNLAHAGGILYTEYGAGIKKINLANGEISGTPLPENTGDEDWLSRYHSDMEIDAGGLVYFSGPYSPSFDSTGCRIQTFNLTTLVLQNHIAEGTSEVLASMAGAPGLAIHQNGDIYLANFYGSGVEVYDEKMVFLLKQGLEAIGERDDLPIDLSTFKDRIYVLDYANDLVQVFTISN